MIIAPGHQVFKSPRPIFHCTDTLGSHVVLLVAGCRPLAHLAMAEFARSRSGCVLGASAYIGVRYPRLLVRTGAKGTGPLRHPRDHGNVAYVISGAIRVTKGVAKFGLQTVSGKEGQPKLTRTRAPSRIDSGVAQVKCDRVRTGCQPCSRLDLECSYNLPPTSGGRCITEGSEGPEGELTQAGLKRRRIRRACTVCRSLKAKCSGDQPCGRCQCYKLHCTYSDSHSDAAQQQSPQHSTISSVPDGLRGHPQAERLLAPPVCLPETPETLGTHSVGSSQ